MKQRCRQRLERWTSRPTCCTTCPPLLTTGAGGGKEKQSRHPGPKAWSTKSPTSEWGRSSECGGHQGEPTGSLRSERPCWTKDCQPDTSMQLEPQILSTPVVLSACVLHRAFDFLSPTALYQSGRTLKRRATRVSRGRHPARLARYRVSSPLVMAEHLGSVIAANQEHVIGFALGRRSHTR